MDRRHREKKIRITPNVNSDHSFPLPQLLQCNYKKIKKKFPSFIKLASQWIHCQGTKTLRRSRRRVTFVPQQLSTSITQAHILPDLCLYSGHRCRGRNLKFQDWFAFTWTESNAAYRFSSRILPGLRVTRSFVPPHNHPGFSSKTCYRGLPVDVYILTISATTTAATGTVRTHAAPGTLCLLAVFLQTELPGQSIHVCISKSSGKWPRRRVLPIYTPTNKGGRYLFSHGLTTLDISSNAISFSSSPRPPPRPVWWVKSGICYFLRPSFVLITGGVSIRHFFILVEKPKTL